METLYMQAKVFLEVDRSGPKQAKVGRSRLKWAEALPRFSWRRGKLKYSELGRGMAEVGRSFLTPRYTVF